MISQICSVRLRFGELGGKDINWNSVLCSWNPSSTIRVLWYGALSCWKISFLIGKTDVMMQLVYNDVQIVSSFHELFYTTKGTRKVHGNVSQCIIPPPVAYVWPAVRLEDDLGMVIDVMNYESLFIQPSNSLPLVHGPVTIFSGPSVGVVGNGAWSIETRVRRLLRSSLSSSFRCTVWSKTLPLGPAMFWAVSWATVWHWYYFTKRDSLCDPFSLIMRGRPMPCQLLLVLSPFIHFS